MSQLLAVTLSPASVVATTGNEQTFTVAGLQLGDLISVSKPTFQNYISIVNARVSAANTLAIGFGNSSTANLTPTASEVYLVSVDRGGAIPYTTLPNGIE
jgi:hypothetical protein